MFNLPMTTVTNKKPKGVKKKKKKMTANRSSTFILGKKLMDENLLVQGSISPVLGSSQMSKQWMFV